MLKKVTLIMVFFFSFHVYVVCPNIVALQSHFLLSGFQVSGKWIVPISFALGSYKTTKKFLMVSEQEMVNASELFPSNSNSEKEMIQEEYGITTWIKVNVDQSGFYRVKYGDELAISLRNAILDGCLSVTDKYGAYNWY